MRTHNLFSEAFVNQNETSADKTGEEKKKEQRGEKGVEPSDADDFKSEGGKGEQLTLLSLKMAPKYFIPARSFVSSELSKLEPV